MKLSFKFDRNKYNVAERNQVINNDISSILNANGIEAARFYAPSCDSIKVLFINEPALNKAIIKTEILKAAGFEPRMFLALKASRTVYCHSFDDSLITSYTPTNMKDNLIQGGWKVNNIYIMNSKKSLKIEFLDSAQANKFINKSNTSIGGIPIHKDSKEIEIDPTVPQCWECGQLNPRHNSSDC